jgi:DNA polymerase III subunit delta
VGRVLWTAPTDRPSELKINAENLSAHLNRLPHIALVSGDDPLLVGEACDAIRAKARSQGFAEREIHFAERGFDWQALLMASKSMSLFAERKLIEIRLGGAKMDQEASATIADLAANRSDDTIVLLIGDKLDGKQQSSKWVTSIEKEGWLVQVWPIDLARLPTWVRARMTQRGLQADNDVANLIADRVEGNLLAAHQEIEKLALLHPNGKIDAATVLDAVADSARYDVLQVGLAAMSGQTARAIRVLDGLRAEGIDATVILWGINKDLQWMVRVAHLMKAGQSADAAMNAEYVWRPRQAAMKMALARLKPVALHALLRDAALVDRGIKGVRKTDAWLELQALVVRIAGARLKRVA